MSEPKFIHKLPLQAAYKTKLSKKEQKATELRVLSKVLSQMRNYDIPQARLIPQDRTQPIRECHINFPLQGHYQINLEKKFVYLNENDYSNFVLNKDKQLLRFWRDVDADIS